MGDILHALPAVTALAPGASCWQIGWVVEPRLAGTAGRRDQRSEIRDQRARGSAMPVVDRLHFAASRAWKRHPLSGKTLSQIKELRRELRAAKYDACLICKAPYRSAVDWAHERLRAAHRRSFGRASGLRIGSHRAQLLRTART